jgi:protein-disulfide isomerase
VERPIRGHFYAVPAAQAALSANAQGKFWPMYDTLYMHHTDLEPGFYSDYAAKIGLNGAALQKDVDSHRYQSQVEESVKFCTSIGIVSTPTIAVRNNKTGQVTAAVGLENIMALLKQPPWSTSAPPGSAVAAAPGSGSIVAKGQ